MTTSDANVVPPRTNTTNQLSDTKVVFNQVIHSAFMTNFIAGGMAGCVSRTVVSPLERMKIIYQIQTPGSQNYKGIWPTLVKMWREEGWRGYMRGNGSNCLRIFPYSAIQFASYNIYKPYLLSPGESDLSVGMRLVAGGLAGITSVAITYPLDITRTRLSIQCADLSNLSRAEQAKLPGMWGVMKDIYKHEGGMLGLYRGIMPTIYGVAPYVGLNFAVYESVRKHFVKASGTEPTALEKLASGAVSGAVAQFLTYPFDVLRRRFQVNSMMGNPYRNVWHACRVILAKEGLRGFYQGLAANLLKIIPAQIVLSVMSALFVDWTFGNNSDKSFPSHVHKDDHILTMKLELKK